MKSVVRSGFAPLVVYVDSGSIDGSVDFAKNLGCHVVSLDMKQPFTAARARNAGVAYALSVSPLLTHIQFIDGDCELSAQWLNVALQFLQENPAVAVACGRRRERYRQQSWPVTGCGCHREVFRDDDIGAACRRHPDTRC